MGVSGHTLSQQPKVGSQPCLYNPPHPPPPPQIESTGGKSFVPYYHRFYTPATEANGPSNGNWYAITIGLVRWVFISDYESYSKGSAQYNFIQSEFSNIDRDVRVWVEVCAPADPARWAMGAYGSCMMGTGRAQILHDWRRARADSAPCEVGACRSFTMGDKPPLSHPRTVTSPCPPIAPPSSPLLP